MRTIRGWTAVLLVGIMAGCGGDEPPAASATGEPTEVSYAPALEISLNEMDRTPSGLYLQDETVGGGQEAVPGATVVVHYTGWLPNGEKFDSSRDHGEPFRFTLGAGEVIPGWDEGVAEMRVGGRRKLVIPPALAYGESGAGGVIPPNATLVFDVELLEVQ